MKIDNVWVTVSCPKCNYQFDVLILQIRLEDYVFCPCCKIDISLKDDDASVNKVNREIENSIKDLMSSLKKAFN